MLPTVSSSELSPLLLKTAASPSPETDATRHIANNAAKAKHKKIIWPRIFEISLSKFRNFCWRFVEDLRIFDELMSCCEKLPSIYSEAVEIILELWTQYHTHIWIHYLAFLTGWNNESLITNWNEIVNSMERGNLYGLVRLERKTTGKSQYFRTKNLRIILVFAATMNHFESFADWWDQVRSSQIYQPWQFRIKIKLSAAEVIATWTIHLLRQAL